MGHGNMNINDGILKHTYYPKPRRGKRDSMDEEEEDYFGCFEVGRDEEGRPNYGPSTPSFFDMEDEMERALAMEAFFNPFKNIFVFNKLTDFLGSLPVQLKNLEWGPMDLATTRRKKEMENDMSNLILYAQAGETLQEGSKHTRQNGRYPESTKVKTFLGMNIFKAK